MRLFYLCMNDSKNNLILLGKCTRPHGIRGEFDFHLINLEDSVVDVDSRVFLIPLSAQSKLPSDGQWFEVEQIRFGNKVIARLKGVADRNGVEALVPFEIYLDRSDFPEVEDDEFYIVDLLGLDVYSEGLRIGIVKDFYDNGAQTVLVIKGEGRIIELPFVDHFIEAIDIEAKRIDILMPDYIE